MSSQYVTKTTIYEKTNNLNFINNLKFCSAKYSVKMVKDKP